MAKTDPSYETGWHTTGTLEVLPSVEQIAQRLEANPDVVMHRLNLSKEPGGWWSYDAVWITADGARVRGRLNIHNRHPNGDLDPEWDEIDPRGYDPKTNPLRGYFHAYADADRPWDVSWPSPLNVFLDRKMKPSYATVEFAQHNLMSPDSTRLKSLPGFVQALAEMGWIAAVFTHEELSVDILFEKGAGYRMPLISRLPPSLYGRVIDMRVMGEESRKRVNRVLARYGTELPPGGAAIVLATDRRKGLQRSAVSFPMSPALAEGGDLGPLAASLTEMLKTQLLGVDQEAIDELRKGWTLLTEQERAEQEAQAMDEAADTIQALKEQNAGLALALAASQEFIEHFQKSGDDLLAEAKKAIEGERKALEGQKKLRAELDRLLRMIRDSDLGKAQEARETAEEETELAEELLDEMNHETVSLRREVGRLRRELARLGSTFELSSSAEEETVPENWDDFFSRCSALEYVALGPVKDEVEKLRGQSQEKTFIRRSWEALMALDEYAAMKKERGTSEVPHFGAYLRDPAAERAIPRTRYSASESKGVMMNGRFVAARTLPVPRQVDESGRILMEEHIRVGSGKPPAPRLHFYDDTSGETGKIYIGHLGPHLPNYQTN